MNADYLDISKAIIVEGKTDKEMIEDILDERVDIICTNGTLYPGQLEELLDFNNYDEVFVLVDADQAGRELRKVIKDEFPGIRDLYTRKKYKEVAATPIEELIEILSKAHFKVKEYDGIILEKIQKNR